MDRPYVDASALFQSTGNAVPTALLALRLHSFRWRSFFWASLHVCVGSW